MHHRVSTAIQNRLKEHDKGDFPILFHVFDAIIGFFLHTWKGGGGGGGGGGGKSLKTKRRGCVTSVGRCCC